MFENFINTDGNYFCEAGNAFIYCNFRNLAFLFLIFCILIGIMLIYITGTNIKKKE
jgi:hypothetical protein